MVLLRDSPLDCVCDKTCSWQGDRRRRIDPRVLRLIGERCMCTLCVCVLQGHVSTCSFHQDTNPELLRSCSSAGSEPETMTVFRFLRLWHLKEQVIYSDLFMSISVHFHELRYSVIESYLFLRIIWNFETRYKLIFIYAPQLPQINMVRVCNRAGGVITVTLPFVCDFTFMTTARQGQIPKDRL